MSESLRIVEDESCGLANDSDRLLLRAGSVSFWTFCQMAAG